MITVRSNRLPMQSLLLAASLLVLLNAATVAHGQTGETRAGVKSELATAIRAGDVVGPGDRALSAREREPARYAPTRKTQALHLHRRRKSAPLEIAATGPAGAK